MRTSSRIDGFDGTPKVLEVARWKKSPSCDQTQDVAVLGGLLTKGDWSPVPPDGFQRSIHFIRRSRVGVVTSSVKDLFTGVKKISPRVILRWWNSVVRVGLCAEAPIERSVKSALRPAVHKRHMEYSSPPRVRLPVPKCLSAHGPSQRTNQGDDKPLKAGALIRGLAESSVRREGPVPANNASTAWAWVGRGGGPGHAPEAAHMDTVTIQAVGETHRWGMLSKGLHADGAVLAWLVRDSLEGAQADIRGQRCARLKGDVGGVARNNKGGGRKISTKPPPLCRADQGSPGLWQTTSAVLNMIPP